jgi:hypothetical protein
MNLKHFYFVTAALHSRSQNTKVAESSKAQAIPCTRQCIHHTATPLVRPCYTQHLEEKNKMNSTHR